MRSPDHPRRLRGIPTGPVDPERVPTVGQFLDDWLAGKQSLRPSTALSYATHIRLYLSPYLGVLRLDALRPLHIERMYREIALLGDEHARPLSVSTRRRIQATLMSALNTAVRRGLIERNPAATVELPPLPRPRVLTWSAAELGQFLAAIQDDRLHLLYRLLGLVGLRRGEVVALRWRDVDLNAGSLRIEQSAVRVAGRSVVGPPKSASGSRLVAVDDETARRLHWHGCRQRLELARTTGALVKPDL